MKINKHKVALIADPHLGLHISSSVWHGISLDFALWLKQTLMDHDVTDIIILGDVIDNRNEVSVTTLHTVYKFFKILEDFNIIIDVGNHDCYYSKRSDVHSLGTLNDWPNIEIVDKAVTVNMFNKTMTFCPWNAPLDTLPKSDILFGHFEINTFKMNGGHVCGNGVDSQSILEKAPLVLTGHFHRTEERSYKNGRIIYVGSPYEQSWGEYGDPKGIYLLDLHDNALEFIPNTKSPKHIKIRLSELLAVGKITDNIKSEFSGNIINFIIDMEVDQKVIDTLLTKFYALNPVSIKTENLLLTQNIVSVDAEMKFEGVDVKADIVNFIANLEGVENKNELTNYLVNAYDRCMEDKK